VRVACYFEAALDCSRVICISFEDSTANEVMIRRLKDVDGITRAINDPVLLTASFWKDSREFETWQWR
jgi:hypothetical protein